MARNDQIQPEGTVEEAADAAGVEEPRDVRTINIDVGGAIADSLRPTLGPTGADKMLVDQAGNVIVTNNGATIMGELGVEMDLVASAALMTELALAQRDRFGDGTKTAVLLAGELLSEAGTLIDRGLHPTTIIEGYDRSAERVAGVLEGMAFDSGDDEWLTAAARMAMIGRGAVGMDEALSELVVEAVRAVEEDGTVNLDDVTTVTVRGGTVSDSVLVEGVVVDTEAEPVLPSMPLSLPDAGVLCLDTLLDPTTRRTGKVATLGVETPVGDPDEIRAWAKAEHEAAEELARRLSELGVTVVISEENFSDAVAAHLASNGILGFRQMTEETVDTVARATGASVVSTVTDLDPDDIGRVDLAEYRGIGRRDYLVFEGCENPHSLSILLRGGTIHSVDEVERSVRNGLGVVKAVVESGRVVPGGGAPELEAAHVLREYATGVDGREQLAIRAFADAIENLPRALARNMAFDQIDCLIELRNRHAAGEVNAGVLPDDRVVEDVAAHGVVEPLPTKRQAILGAVEVVGRTLRVDDLVAAKQLDRNYTEEFRRDLNRNTDLAVPEGTRAFDPEPDAADFSGEIG